MPIKPNQGETRPAFVTRCMEAETSIPTESNQRVAACMSMWRRGRAEKLAKEVKTFDEALDTRQAREALWAVTSGFRDLLGALEESLESILAEGGDGVAVAMREAVADYVATVATVAPGAVTRLERGSGDDGSVLLKNEDERLVFGVFNLASVHGELEVDKQDDVIEPAELEAAMYDFVLNARVASEAHDRVGVGDLVEAMVITPAKEAAIVELLKAHGVEDPQFDLGAIVAWGGFKVTDDEVWKAVKDGRYVSFSIGGSATSEPVAA